MGDISNPTDAGLLIHMGSKPQAGEDSREMTTRAQPRGGGH